MKTVIWAAIAAVFLVALGGRPALAQGPLGEEIDLTPPRLGSPTPPEDADVLLLKSGEIIYGSLKSFFDDGLEFDSDAIGDISLDWSDVETLYTAKTYTWVLDDLERLVGPGKMEDGLLQVQTEAGPRTLPRTRLLRIYAGEPSEIDYWSAKIYLGITGTTGNTRQVTGVANIDVRRETELTRLDLGYRGVYGLSDDEEVAKAHTGIFELRAFLSRRFYLIPAIGRVVYDRFQNLELRVIAGSGAGYFLIREPGIEWALEGGVSHTYTVIRRPGPTVDKYQTSVQARVATKVEWDITDDVKFTGLYEVLIGLNDIEDTLHHGEATLSIDLFDGVNLAASVIWDRIERPLLRADGSRPHHDDAKYTIGLTVEL